MANASGLGNTELITYVIDAKSQTTKLAGVFEEKSAAYYIKDMGLRPSRFGLITRARERAPSLFSQPLEHEKF